MTPERKANQQNPNVAVGRESSAWTSRQRNDLKPCPFCGSQAMERARLYDNATATIWVIQCSNPFCMLICKTTECASLTNAEDLWQERTNG